MQKPSQALSITSWRETAKIPYVTNHFQADLLADCCDQTIFHFFEHYENKAAFEAHVQREDSQQIFREGYFRDVEARIEKPIE